MTQFIADYKDRLRAATYSWWASKARVGAYIKALGSVFQTVEEDVYGLVFSLPISQASGTTLDKWGDILGEQRLGLNDAAYRRVLRAKIAFLAAKGSGPRILDAFTNFTGDPEPKIELSDSGFLRVSYTADLSASEQERLLRLLAPAPVAGFATEVLELSSDPFLFGDTFGKSFGAERIDP